ncbi:DEKNAAC101772 [Brettanomyces naardenensis]|uniref:DEKNAAC101772 n=1 Tax=Brettanomyces naardenensis TaxID=13370 RepID=A0A448YII4_BRENA|nr:DEKNAAC101772 [Brettanomyces naardenensis]
MADASKKNTVLEKTSENDGSSEEIAYAPTTTGKEAEATTSVLSTVDTLEAQSEVVPNPFLNDKVADHYRDLYETTHYECRKRFDPEFTWTAEEQKKLNRKLDWKVALLACVLFVSLQTDRGNLGQAVADNMLKELNMTNNQYNTGNTIFYLCFLSAELPSQLISKRLGCDIWIPIEMCLWALVSLSQCKLTSATGFYITRALLGVFEGGFIPDLVLWMSYFYTGAELTIRLSFFWTSMALTQIVTSVLAYGIFHLRGVGGMGGWSWLFLIEGLMTLVIGIAGFFLMVPSAVQTKKPWNKNGWFTEREEYIVVNKILRDDPTKGDIHNRQGLTPKMLWEAMCDYYLWPVYIIGIVAYVPMNALTAYLTLLLKSMGYSTFDVNLLAIPNYVLHFILLLWITWYSEKTRSIFNVCLFQPLWAVPLLGVLRWWNGSFADKWPTYVVITLILATPYIHAMMVSVCSRNAQSIKTRTVSASLYNMFVQAGSIIASNIFQVKDAPLYHKGNAALFGLAAAMIPLLIFTKWFYVTINNRREKKWSAMTYEEREHYILTTKDKGSSRLNFRFAH